MRFVREDDVLLLLLLLLPLVINAGNRPLIFPETGKRLFSDAVAVEWEESNLDSGRRDNNENSGSSGFVRSGGRSRSRQLSSVENKCASKK